MKKISFCLFFIALSLNALCQRTTTTINEAWRFYRGDITTAMRASFNDKSWQVLNLPNSWNAQDANNTRNYYRGIGWYRKILSEPVRQGEKYYLHFEGASQLADVYVNGKYAGRHAGGYTAFTFDITNLLFYSKDSVNVISVKVDNSYNKNIAPLSGDFTFWGGIYRDVYLIELQPVHFSMDNYGSNGVFVETPQVSSTSASVRIRSSIKNDGSVSEFVKIVSVITDAEGKKVQTLSAKAKLLPGKEKNIDLLSGKILSPQLWTPDDPYLYHVSTRITDIKTGEIIDNIVNPLGFRWFSVDTKNGFMLNGKPIKLIGAARHQDYPRIGNALSNDLNYRDVKLLKEMGANYIRIAHYPQDPTILEACDKLGIIAWEEIPIVNRITPTQAFYDNCKNNLLEMIRQNYNHPSIFIWAYSNEVMLGRNKEDEFDGYDFALVKFLTDLESTVRSEDPHRITSIACHAGDIYNKSGVADIPMTVGWNRYDGLGSKYLQDFSKFLNEAGTRYPERPIFISEYGAGSDARLHSLNPERGDYSIEFQQFFHEFYLPEILKRKFVVGASIWNLVDFGSALRQESMAHVNNKGIMYQNRNPKDVYYYYQAMLSKKPMVHIASRDWTLRTGTPENEADNFAYQSVKIYSNLKEVELFLNHKSIGKQPVNNCFAIYNVPFIDGKNMLVVKAKTSDNQIVYDNLTINFELNPYLLNECKKNDLQIAVNTGSNCFYTDDQAKIIYQPDQPFRKGSWGYVGEHSNVTGMQLEVNATDNGPLFQTARENMAAYKFDVPDGTYTVDLYFCEPICSAPKSLYILDSKDINASANRVFNVSLNGQKTISDFNLAKSCGALMSVIKTYTVSVVNGRGINIEFETVIGKPIISGIKINRDY